MAEIGSKLSVVSMALLFAVSSTSAQPSPGTSSPTSTSTSVVPPPPAPPDMVEAPPPAQPVEPPDKGLKVGFSWALQLGVPVFLDVDRDILKAGADVSFFGGADFDWFVIGGAAGVGWNPVDLNGEVVEGVVLTGRSPLTRLFFSIPEFRVQIPNLEVVLPYVSGAFDINFWNYRETEVECGFYYCSSVEVYRFTPGFTGRGGVAFQIKNFIYIDTGLRYSFTGKGDFFESSRWFLVPYIGVLVRRR